MGADGFEQPVAVTKAVIISPQVGFGRGLQLAVDEEAQGRGGRKLAAREWLRFVPLNRSR